MRIRLNITNLSICGELEISDDAPPEAIGALLAERSAPLELPAAEPAPAMPEPEACCAPIVAKAHKPRAPKPTAEPTGAIRVDTGRRSTAETLDALRSNQPCGPSRLGEVLGISSAAAAQRLSVLLGKGEVRLVSRGNYEVIPQG